MTGKEVQKTVQDLAQSGNKKEAAALAKDAAARNPDNQDLQKLAVAAERQYKDELAVAAAQEKGQKAGETIADRWKKLMAGAMGDPGEVPPGAALTSPEMATAISFPNLGARPRMTPEALSALGQSRSAAAGIGNPLVTDALRKLNIKDLDGAKSLLDRRLLDAPNDELALRTRAYLLRQQKMYQQSAHDAKRAVDILPGDSYAGGILIADIADLGRPQQALEVANQAIAEFPRDARLLVARAYVHGKMGDTAERLDDLRRAAQLDDREFGQLYRQELAAVGAAAPAAPERGSRRPASMAVWLGAIGTALFFFSFALFRKRGEASMRTAMRREDHDLLSRGARPEAAPAGFQIVKTLGEGGMGIVYDAVDLALQRPVALKKLRSEVAESPRDRAHFLKEARTVAALKHPNIVEIHSIHEGADGLFLVFEKVSGETLHERLGRGPLRPAEAVHLLRQIASALDYAHHAGVVHQDLKPSNMMVSGETLKVMDFGIARRVADIMSTLSRMEIKGTPAYMAPEQERGGAVGPAADIFALGACAYEFLTGKTPFPNGGLMMKTEKMFRPASELNPGLREATDASIARALDPDPARRWPTAASFVEALARSLAVTAS